MVDAGPSPAAASTAVSSPEEAAGSRRAIWRVRDTLGETLLLLPLVALTAGVILVPVGIALYRSLFEWNPGYDSSFVGIDNFIELARSSTFVEILRNEGVFLLGLPLWTLLPLVLALLLYERVPAAGLFRTIFFLPAVLSPAILGILFRTILAPDGPLNAILADLGLGSLAHGWLDEPELVKPVLIFVLAWAGLGTGVVIFSAALSGVPPELFEAAELDGASWWQKLRYVMLPSLKYVVVGWVVFQVISIFLFTFGWIYVLTGGGPGYASTTLDFDIYQNSIGLGYFGLAAAEAVYLLAIVALIVLMGALFAKQRSRRELRTAAGTGSSHMTKIVENLSVKWFAADRALRNRITLARRWLRLSWRRVSPPTTGEIEPQPERSRWSKSRTAIVVVATIPFLYPFVFLLTTAFKTQSDFVHNPISVIPRHLTLDHVQYAWSAATLGRSLVNSMIAVTVGVVLCVVVSSAGAFWFLLHPGRWAKILLTIIMGLWIVPFVVYIIPFFVILSTLALTDNLIVLGVVYAALNAPFGAYFMYAYYRGAIPIEIIEASRIDGASLIQQLGRVILPLSKPAIFTLAALTFVWSWGDLLAGVVLLQDPEKWTATVAASSLVAKFEPVIQQSAAAGLIAVLPLIVIFLFAQKAIMRGFTAGLGNQ